MLAFGASAYGYSTGDPTSPQPDFGADQGSLPTGKATVATAPPDPNAVHGGVSSVSFSPTTLNLSVGQTASPIAALVHRADGSDTTIFLGIDDVTGGDPTIAHSDDGGVIVAAGSGRTVLTATYHSTSTYSGTIAVRVIDPVPVDTTCASNADAVPTIGALASQKYGPMASLSLQAQLYVLADAAWATTSQNEKGGVIVLRNGDYQFVEVAPNFGSQCSFAPLGGYPVAPPAAGDVVVGYVHTHPPFGAHLVCPELGTDSLRTASDFGPSAQDKSVAGTSTAPYTDANYVIDKGTGVLPNAITRFTSAGAVAGWHANAGACSVPTQ